MKLYKCNPKRNKECTKENCYINGGECKRTTNKQYKRRLFDRKTEYLQPCPWCGKKAHLRKGIFGTFYVSCSNIFCENKGAYCDKKSRAIEYWNKIEIKADNKI